MKDYLLSFGKTIFKYRDYTPVPFIIWLLYITNTSVFHFFLGLMVTLLGEGIRFYGVYFIGSISRTRTQALGARLISEGPFSVVRNPLYLGNLLIVLGIVIFSGHILLTPLFFAFFFIQYVPIVTWEEENLLKTFGNEYTDYKNRVARWWPNWMEVNKLISSFTLGAVFQDPNSISATVRSERNTLAAITTVLGLMWVKSFLFT